MSLWLRCGHDPDPGRFSYHCGIGTSYTFFVSNLEISAKLTNFVPCMFKTRYQHFEMRMS